MTGPDPDGDLAPERGLAPERDLAPHRDLAPDLDLDLDLDLGRMLDRTRALVEIDSGSQDQAGVDAVTEAVESYLAPLGFTARRTFIGPGRGAFFTATLELGPGPRVLILGHADTVWPKGTAAGWPFRRDGDQLTGPGVGDMKCALVMAAEAITVVIETAGSKGLGGSARHGGPGTAGPWARLGPGRIDFVLVPDEELGSVGSRPLIEEAGRNADCCLTLEAGLPGGGVITSRGAVGAMIITARGRSAHATEYTGTDRTGTNYVGTDRTGTEYTGTEYTGTEYTGTEYTGTEYTGTEYTGTEYAGAKRTGASALRALAPLVAELEALTDYAQRRIVTVGILRAGTSRQVVPDRAEMHVDLRAPDAESGGALERTVRELAQARTTEDVRVEIAGGITRPPMPASLSAGLYARAERACHALGLPIFAHAEMGGSDGSLVAAQGTPTLDGLGPIARDQCSRRETVEVPTIIPRTTLLATLLATA